MLGNKDSLRVHLKTHDTIRYTYKCGSCDGEYLSAQSVIGHHKKCHLNKPVKYIASQREKRAPTPPPTPPVITDPKNIKLNIVPRSDEKKVKKPKYQDPILDNDDDSDLDPVPSTSGQVTKDPPKKEKKNKKFPLKIALGKKRGIATTTTTSSGEARSKPKVTPEVRAKCKAIESKLNKKEVEDKKDSNIQKKPRTGPSLDSLENEMIISSDEESDSSLDELEQKVITEAFPEENNNNNKNKQPSSEIPEIIRNLQPQMRAVTPTKDEHPITQMATMLSLFLHTLSSQHPKQPDLD